MEEFDQLLSIARATDARWFSCVRLLSFLQRLGSVRGEDIPYIFGLPLVAGGAFFPRNYSRQDQGVAEAVLTFFTNFAKTGNPNEPHKIESVDYGTPKEKTRFRGLTWEQYETGSQQYLTIGESWGTRISLSFSFSFLLLRYFSMNFIFHSRAERRSLARPRFRNVATFFKFPFPLPSLSSSPSSFPRKKFLRESDCVIVRWDLPCISWRSLKVSLRA